MFHWAFQNLSPLAVEEDMGREETSTNCIRRSGGTSTGWIQIGKLQHQHLFPHRILKRGSLT